MTATPHAVLERRVTVLEKRSAVDEVHRLHIADALSKIEATLQWLVRILVGTILAALIAWIVNGGLA